MAPNWSSGSKRRSRGPPDNDRLTLVIALNYGSRAEIATAARRLAAERQRGEIDPQAIDEEALAAELQTDDLPPLDLLIRTSGEDRLSNFLLWQAAYAELLFVDTLWPDFDETGLRRRARAVRRARAALWWTVNELAVRTLTGTLF